MKRYRPSRRRQQKDRTEPGRWFRSPAQDFYHLPDLVLRGGHVATDGCRRVLDFTPEKICLDMGNFIVTFYGTELRIESLTGKRLILVGRIANISFRNKWEVSEHGT